MRALKDSQTQGNAASARAPLHIIYLTTSVYVAVDIHISRFIHLNLIVHSETGEFFCVCVIALKQACQCNP